MTPLRVVAIFALSALLAVGLGRVPVARAEDAATRSSRHHFQKGEKLFALGRFDEALEQYEQAFEARPLPAFLFNIGQCHRNLGNFEQAIFSFRKYLRQVPDADNREAVEDLIDELEASRRAADEAARRREAARFGGGDPPPKRDPPRARKPIYARWWFWGGIAAAAGAGAGAYFVLRDDGVPSTDLGNVVFD